MGIGNILLGVILSWTRLPSQWVVGVRDLGGGVVFVSDCFLLSVQKQDLMPYGPPMACV